MRFKYKKNGLDITSYDELGKEEKCSSKIFMINLTLAAGISRFLFGYVTRIVSGAHYT
jgi:hypothetical protein